MGTGRSTAWLLGLPLTSRDGRTRTPVLLMGRLLDAGSESCLDGSTPGDVTGRSVRSSLSSRSASEWKELPLSLG